MIVRSPLAIRTSSQEPGAAATVDRKMIDAGLAADIDIREFAMKAGAAVHIGESALRYVENARDVLP